MSDTLRTVSLTHDGPASFTATNVRGTTLTIGDGSTDDFTPVELLLVAIGGCGALDLDAMLGKRSSFDSFDVDVRADKIRDDGGNHLVNIRVTFDPKFPDGADGDRAREFYPKATEMSHDRLCTVTRTVILGSDVEFADVSEALEG